MKKRLLALIMAVVITLPIAACAGQNANTGANSTAAANNTTAAATAAPANTEQKMKNIFVIIKGLGNAYWAILQAGATQAGKDLGCNVTIQGIPNEVDIEVQLGMLQNAVSAQADAIVIAVADSKAEANAVSDAYKSGIPIVMVDTKALTEDYSAALLTDNVAAGKLAAEELIKKMKNKVADTEKAEVAIQIGSTGSQTIKLRMDGFQEYWAANAPKSWVLLTDDIKVNDGDITKAIQFGHDFLTAYPNIKGFFSPNNGSTVGFATALKEANRTDISMVGFDFSKEMEAIIRDSNFNVATMLQRQYKMGYDGVKIALDLANGGTVSQKDIDTGVMAVDFSNVDSDEVKSASGASAAPAAAAAAAQPSSSPAANQTITVMYTFSEQTKRDAFQQWCDKVKADHPNYDFQISAITDNNQYRPLIKTKYSAGDPVDIMFGAPRDFSDMAAAGMLQDLTGAPFIQNIDPQYITGGASQVNGVTYGIPIDLGLLLVFYNKDIFSQNNLTVPANYKDFIAVCSALNAKGINPLSMGYKDGWTAGVDFMFEWYMILNKNPNFFKDVDEGRKKFADYPELKNAMQRSIDRFNTSTGNPFGTDNNTSVQDFAAGKAAMFLTGTWNIMTIRNLTPNGSFGVFPLPADNEADTVARLYVDDSFMVANGTKNMNAITDLFNYATSSEGASNWSKTTGAIPIAKGVSLQNPDAMTKEAAAIKDSGKIIFADAQYQPTGQTFDVFFGKFSVDFLIDQKKGLDANIAQLDQEYAQALQPTN